MHLISAEKKRFLTQAILQPLIGYLIPFLVLCWFISFFGVNTPYWDQWELIDLFDKIASGKATFQDFFAQHNEHRILFPKLIIVALAFISKWNIFWELYFNLFLGIIIFLTIYQLSARQTESQGFIFHAANGTTCVAIFSLVQWENWLWGFQIAWFLINLCLLLAIFSLSAQRSVTWKTLSLTAVLCGIASFSSAHGLLTWLVLFPLIFACSKHLKHFAIVGIVWLALFVICYQLYFMHYDRPLNPAGLPLNWQDVLSIRIEFALRLLGNPVFYKSSGSVWAGMGLVVNFGCFVIVWLQRSRRSLLRSATPWISLGMFPILFAGLVAMGRAESGLEQASASRYTTVSILLIVALMQLWRLEVCHYLSQRSQEGFLLPTFNRFSQYCLVVGAGIATVWVASVQSLAEVGAYHSRLQYGQNCLEIAQYLPTSQRDCLTSLYPSVEVALQRSQVLRQLGFLHAVKSLSIDAKPTQTYGYFDPPIALTTPSTSPSEAVWRISKNCETCQSLKVKGWAINPVQQQAAQLVVLSYGDQAPSPQTIIATAAVGLPSADVAQALASQHYAYARWETTLSAKSIPPDATIINAWMYDPVNQKLVKLSSALKVKVEE